MSHFMKSKVLKSGAEPFVCAGESLPVNLRDFWSWSVSDLVSNATRGRLAEFIVATALGVDLTKPRDEWQAFDLKLPDGTKVEVKSAAYVQTWHQKRLSAISFSTRASRYWDAETNIQAQEVRRQADMYVFCLLKHKDRDTIDPLNLDQWCFYVVPTKALEAYKRSQTSITLRSLEKLTTSIPYRELKKAVLAARRGTTP